MIDLTFRQDGKPNWDLAHWQGKDRARQLQFVDRPAKVFGTTRVCRMEAVDGDQWPQSPRVPDIRCVLTTVPGVRAPAEHEIWTWAFAVEYPADPKCPIPLGTVWEYHQSNQMAAMAPVAHLGCFSHSNGNTYARLGGGNAEGNWDTYWNQPDTLLFKSVPGLHLFVYQVKYERDGSGYFTAMYAPGDPAKMLPKFHRSGATWPWAPSLPPEKPYAISCLYPSGNPGRGPGGNYVFQYGTMVMDVAHTDTEAQAALSAAIASFDPSGPPPVSYKYASSINNGAQLTGQELWTVTSDDPAATHVEFYADNTLLVSVPMLGSGASVKLNLPASSKGGGFHVLAGEEALLYRSPSIGWTVTPPAGLVTATPVPGKPHVYRVNWTPVAGQQGFVPTLDGQQKLTDGRAHPSYDKQAASAQIAIPADGKAHTVGVWIIGGQGQVGSVTVG